MNPTPAPNTKDACGSFRVSHNSFDVRCCTYLFSDVVVTASEHVLLLLDVVVTALCAHGLHVQSTRCYPGNRYARKGKIPKKGNDAEAYKRAQLLYQDALGRLETLRDAIRKA